MASVGTANIDVRSFSLNFEVNVIIYNEELAHRLAEIFERDILDCSELTKELYEARGNAVKFKESISRLLSPIL